MKKKLSKSYHKAVVQITTTRLTILTFLLEEVVYVWFHF